MRFIVDITQTRAEIINKFVTEGRYKSVGHFISAAIENQIYLEESDTAGELVTSPPNLKNGIRLQSLEPIRSLEERPLSITKTSHDESGWPETNTIVNLKIPAATPPPVVAMPKYEQLASSVSSDGEANSWVWGQINKILPVKVGSRVLYLMLLDLGQSMELEQFRNRAADVAFALGDMIREHENKKGKKRDERITAGLPGGDEPFKSKARYKNHFLGYMRKDDKLDGAMSLLKLVNIYRNDRGRILIGLTEAGADFARLENPPIDSRDLDRSLSGKEVEFYLRHVQKNVPGEFQAIRWFLKTISGGITAREEINTKLKEENGKIWRASDAVINPQRAGLTSRASELGLVRAIKSDVGITVHYEITTQGKSLLS
jgi:hypothetical protein